MRIADILGYSFRKKLALTIERQAVAHQVYEQHDQPRDDERGARALQYPWAGGGALDELRDECPFPFTVWVIAGTGERKKVRGAMDVARLRPARPISIPHGMRGDIWWSGVNLDVWLKSSMLTFNRLFPHEINRFNPLLCDAEELAKHVQFAAMFGLERQFSEAYLSGLPIDQQQQGATVLDLAERLTCRT